MYNLILHCDKLLTVTISHSRKSHGLRQNVTFFKVCKHNMGKKNLREIPCVRQSRFLNLFLTLLDQHIFLFISVFLFCLLQTKPTFIFSPLSYLSTILFMLCYLCLFMLVPDTTEFHKSIS